MRVRGQVRRAEQATGHARTATEIDRAEPGPDPLRHTAVTVGGPWGELTFYTFAAEALSYPVGREVDVEITPRRER